MVRFAAPAPSVGWVASPPIDGPGRGSRIAANVLALRIFRAAGTRRLDSPVLPRAGTRVQTDAAACGDVFRPDRLDVCGLSDRARVAPEALAPCDIGRSRGCLRRLRRDCFVQSRRSD